MSQIKLHSDVEAMVKAMPRIETLYYFIYELAASFHADPIALKSIKTGVLDNQILTSIILKYFNKADKKVAEIRIEIDWEKHDLLTKTEDGKTIQIDLSKSVVDNIVTWKKCVTAHVEEIMNQFDVYDVKSSYTYRRDITENKEAYQKALDIMHHVLMAEDDSSVIDIALQSELGDAMQMVTGKVAEGDIKKRSFECGELEEVTVEMTYKAKN